MSWQDESGVNKEETSAQNPRRKSVTQKCVN